MVMCGYHPSSGLVKLDVMGASLLRSNGTFYYADKPCTYTSAICLVPVTAIQYARESATTALLFVGQGSTEGDDQAAFREEPSVAVLRLTEGTMASGGGGNGNGVVGGHSTTVTSHKSVRLSLVTPSRAAPGFVSSIALSGEVAGEYCLIAFDLFVDGFYSTDLIYCKGME